VLFNSTVNIEFVYVILEGIVKFSRMRMRSSSSLASSPQDEEPDEEPDEDLTGVVREGPDLTIMINQIEIYSFDDWQPDKTQ